MKFIFSSNTMPGWQAVIVDVYVLLVRAKSAVEDLAFQAPDFLDLRAARARTQDDCELSEYLFGGIYNRRGVLEVFTETS
jgi:hypothetical protein